MVNDMILYGAVSSREDRALRTVALRGERLRVPDCDLCIALCIPLSGLTGIWGPSALASAQLAVAELNHASGIAGRPCRLTIVDADDYAPRLNVVLGSLLDHGEIEAIVGMHTSFMRERIISVVDSRVPFVYTPLYEGGEHTPGVFALGETPARQLSPAIQWLSTHERARRWALVGHDYVWPRESNRQARAYIARSGGEVVLEQYVNFGTTDFDEVLQKIERARADAVLIALVGEDAVEFNRAFGATRLKHAALRLSAAIEENELLAIGGDATQRLYVASSYFSTLTTDANLVFKERYHQHFGQRAPTLNSLGQSTYEGVHFLASLFEQGVDNVVSRTKKRAPLAYRSAREAAYAGNGLNLAPVYLAVADGHVFRVLTRL